MTVVTTGPPGGNGSDPAGARRVPDPDGVGPAWTEFGRLLRRLRIGADLTQEQLADASGLASRSIGNLERGCTAPRPETVNLLVTALSRGEESPEVLRRLARSIRLTELE